jgi:hypothetical protein
MKQEKIYEFPIDHPLTPAKRKAVEKHIEENAHLSTSPVTFNWNEEDDHVLHIAVDPVLIEVRFRDNVVELFGAAPLWARVLFTQKRKDDLKEQIELVLHKAKFIATKKSKEPRKDEKPSKAKARKQSHS